MIIRKSYFKYCCAERFSSENFMKRSDGPLKEILDELTYTLFSNLLTSDRWPISKESCTLFFHCTLSIFLGVGEETLESQFPIPFPSEAKCLLALLASYSETSLSAAIFKNLNTIIKYLNIYVWSINIHSYQRKIEDIITIQNHSQIITYYLSRNFF